MRKQVYAALQVASNEIRILIGEHHNNRLHILKVERVAHSGIKNNEIVNDESIIEAINKAIINIEKNVKIKVSRVILLVPSIDLERIKRSLHSDVRDPLNRILKENITEIYESAFNLKPIDNRELINAQIYTFKVNGVILRKPPINEKTSRLGAEVDLYYINRKIVYQLASIVERCNLQILDVCVDQIAIAKEASLFDYENDDYIVSIDIERQKCTLGLIFKGRLIHSYILNLSIEKWIEKLVNTFNIPYDLASKLIFNNLDFNKSNPNKNPICLWSKNKKSYTCSQADIMELLKDDILNFIQEIKSACEEILSTGNTRFVLVGEGAMIKGFNHRLENELNSEVSIYLPSSLGARDGALVALLGSFYNHLDMRQWQRAQVSEPQKEVEVNIPLKPEKLKKHDPSKITDRLKKILNQASYGGNDDDE